MTSYINLWNVSVGLLSQKGLLTNSNSPNDVVTIVFTKSLFYGDLTVRPYYIYAGDDSAIRRRRIGVLHMNIRVPIGNSGPVKSSAVPT